MQCSMAWALHRTEKEKPAAGKTDYWRDFWRSGWDSNPRNLAVQLISSQSRYDHFDTAPYLSQHQHLGKRGELMGRTSKNIKLRIPEKPHKIKGFRSGSYRVATTISSQSRYDHFDTAPYLSQHQHLGKRGELMGRTSKNIKLRIPEKPHKIKGFRSGSYRVATTISSAAPSTTRTTLRVYFRPVFFPEICSKIRWRENRRDGKKYSILRFSVLRNIKENQGDEIPSFCRNFESAPL